MLDNMPKYYKISIVINNLLTALTNELTKYNDKLDKLQNSFFINDVEDNIDKWEIDLGITPDASKSLTFRIERVKSKLRSFGVTTKLMIKNVASAFSNGEVDVIEYPSEYRFVVKFVGTKGIPANMDDLTTTLNEIKPAHLAYEYSYIYNTWSFVSFSTWGEVASMTWDGLRSYS